MGIQSREKEREAGDKRLSAGIRMLEKLFVESAVAAAAATAAEMD